MTNNEPTSLVEVIQADRDAAAGAYAELIGFEEAYDEGDWLAGHFARHRLAEHEAIVVHLRATADTYRKNHRVLQSMIRRQIADAIEQGAHIQTGEGNG